MKKIYIFLFTICVLLICSCGGGSTTDTDSSGSQATVTVTYFASQGGYIEGEKSQTVKAVANEGYTFVCWSNGSYESKIEVTAYENTDLYAHFSHASTGLPVVSIVTETGKDVTSKTEYIGCTISLYDTEKNEHFVEQIAQIRGRGNSTWDRFPKKPYKIKFETKQDLFDNGKAKTWVLLADYRDYSLIRNMLAYEVGEEMSELGATPDCQSVEVYLNGKYHGVYLLCEQIEVNDHRVEANEDITTSEPSFLVEMDGLMMCRFMCLTN